MAVVPCMAADLQSLLAPELDSFFLVCKQTSRLLLIVQRCQY